MRAAILAFALAFSAPAWADDDHLMPEPSNFAAPPDGFTVISDYNAMVLDVFRELYARDSEARMIVQPPFEPEFGIAILKGRGEHYRILSLEPAIHLWSYSYVGVLKSGHVQGWDKDGKPVDENAEADALKASLPADYHAVKIARCESDLDRDLARRAIALWERMLVGAHSIRRSATPTASISSRFAATPRTFTSPCPTPGTAWRPTRWTRVATRRPRCSWMSPTH
jgi:hypothetical protein